MVTFCILLLFSFQGKRLFSAFQHNIANTLIYNTLSKSSVTAVSRQRSLAIASLLLGAKLDQASSKLEAVGEISMIPAILRGLYFHRLDDWINAAKWYGIAATVEPIPGKQEQLLISPWMKIAPTGDFRLDAIVDEWKIRADTAPGAKKSETSRGTLEIDCSESTGNPRAAVLEWNQEFDIPYHHTLVLRAKIDTGSYLILATVIDGQLVRHLVEYGTGEWADFDVSLRGEHVRYIYVQVREDVEASEPSCLAEIKSLTFLLDE